MYLHKSTWSVRSGLLWMDGTKEEVFHAQLLFEWGNET